MADNLYEYEDVQKIPAHLTIGQNNSPPVNATVNYSGWPGNKYSSFNIERMVTNAPDFPEFTYAHMIWVTRIYRNSESLTSAVGGYFNPRFSMYLDERIDVDQAGDIREARFNYTTLVKADGVTVARVMRSLGYTDAEIEADSYVVAGGWSASDFLEWATFIASPETYCTDASGGSGDPNEFWAHTDTKLLMPQGRLADISGTGNYIKLDFERQDGVSEAQTQALVEHLAGLCHAKSQKLSVWPNTISNDGAIYSGITGNNLNGIVEAADLFSLLVWYNGTELIKDQLASIWAIVTAAAVDQFPEKLSVTFSLGDPGGNNTRVEDASLVVRWAKQRGITSFDFWRNGGVQGEADPNDHVNRKIAVIAFQANIPRPSTSHILF